MHMRATNNRQRLLLRILPVLIIGMGVLQVAKWAHGGFVDIWQLLYGIGFLLMGGAQFTSDRLDVSRKYPHVRDAMRTFVVIGFALTIAAIVRGWM